MVRTIECTEDHYEAQEMSWAEAYLCNAQSASCWSVSARKPSAEHVRSRLPLGFQPHVLTQGGAGVRRGNALLG
jgi:hypothetical protein